MISSLEKKVQITPATRLIGNHSKLRALPLVALTVLTALTAITALSAQAATKNHVKAGPYTKKFIQTQGIPTLPKGRANKLMALIKRTPATIKMSRDDMKKFRQNPLYYMKQKRKLEKKITKLKKQNASANQIKKASLDLRKLKREYNFFIKYLRHHPPRDYPFCAAGDSYFKFKLRDGCTSHAKMFMALANGKGYFQDMRLIVTKRYQDLQALYSTLGTGKAPPKTINGHQMVLAKWQNKWYLINTTQYDKKTKKTEILRSFRWGKVHPKHILHRHIRIPSLQGQNQMLSHLVCVAVGKNRHDDLNVSSWKDCMKLATRWSAKKLKVKRP